MRRFCLVASLFLLVAAVYFVWQNRFERSVEYRPVTLHDLRATVSLPEGAAWTDSGDGPRLVLRATPDRPVMIAMELPEIVSADFLHISAELATRNLVPGSEGWQDGKCLITWRSAERPELRENDPIGSGNSNSQSEIEMVMVPEHPGSTPFFFAQNAGMEGEFEVTNLEITVVQESLVWKIGRWVVILAWMGWIVFWISPRGGVARVRAAVVSLVWMLMAANFVIPGPWRSYHSFGSPFNIGEERAVPVSEKQGNSVPRPTISPTTVAQSVEVEVVGDMPEKALVLRVKNYAAKVKELLHVGLLFPPTLIAACLVGRRAAMMQGILFSFAVEVAQISFGFGCDLTDLLDLVCDAAGIALALWICPYLMRFISRYRPKNLRAR